MELRFLTSKEFDQYLEKSIKNYADELVKSGIFDKERAVSESKKSFESFFT